MKVLLAIEGSPHSAAALEELASRRWPAGTEVKVLTVVHSATPLLVDPAFALAATYIETIQELRERAPELLAAAAAARLGRDDADLRITTKVVEGSPRELIVQEAANWGRI